MKFTVYDTGTGQVVRSGMAPDEDAPNQELKTGQAVLLGERLSDTADYITDPGTEQATGAPRPSIPDLNTIPAGTDVYVGGVFSLTVNDGVLTLSGDVPGTYRIRLEPPFPHLPWEFDHVVA